MSSALAIDASCNHCHHADVVSAGTNSSLYEKTEVICRVALAALSAIVSPVKFGFCMAVGVTAGIVNRLHVLYQGTTDSGERDHVHPACAQGFGELLSGRKFPAAVSLVMSAAFAGEHIQHNPGFFVPFAGFFFGMWAADVIYSPLELLADRVSQYT